MSPPHLSHAATGLCFQERHIYTAEVLGVVLQQLLEEPVIPTLLMRTVIMALTHHPQLLSFIITVLLRLIDKEVGPVIHSCREKFMLYSYAVVYFI